MFVSICVSRSIEIATIVYLDIFVKSSARVVLSFCLIFDQYQPAVAYKSVAYKI